MTQHSTHSARGKARRAPTAPDAPRFLDAIATRNTNPLLRVRDLSCVLLIQIICLVATPPDQASKLPPLTTLLAFLEGDGFGLPAPLLAPLRLAIHAILASLPAPIAGPDAAPRAHTPITAPILARATPRARGTHAHISARIAAPAPRIPGIFQNTPLPPASSRAHFVPVS